MTTSHPLDLLACLLATCLLLPSFVTLLAGLQVVVAASSSHGGRTAQPIRTITFFLSTALHRRTNNVPLKGFGVLGNLPHTDQFGAHQFVDYRIVGSESFLPLPQCVCMMVASILCHWDKDMRGVPAQSLALSSLMPWDRSRALF